MNRTPRQIVVIGGGFAGTTLARALQRRLPAGWSVLLVSEESYTTFNPMLAEVVGASVFPEHVVAPIRQMLVTHGVRPPQIQFAASVTEAVSAARREAAA